MKTLASVLLIFTSLNASAVHEYVLESTKIDIQESIAVIIRTDKTPDKVKLSMSVPVGKFECAESYTYEVEQTVMVDCAYINGHDQTSWRCAYHDHRGRCLQFLDTGMPALPTGRLCAKVVPATETECVQSGEVIKNIYDDMVLDFSDLPVLQKGQRDVFRISAKQEWFGDDNIVWGISSLETQVNYKITFSRLLGIFKPRGFNFEVRN